MNEQQIFTCPVHNFIIVLKGDTLDSHGSPGHRASDCPTCESAVNEAFDAIEASA